MDIHQDLMVVILIAGSAWMNPVCQNNAVNVGLINKPRTLKMSHSVPTVASYSADPYSFIAMLEQAEPL